MTPNRFNRLRAKLSALQSFREENAPRVVLHEPYDDDPPERWEAYRQERAEAEDAGKIIIVIRHVGPRGPEPCDY